MPLDGTHPNLKIFKQFGFIYQGNSGSNQVLGRCPFCAGIKKFFVNPTSKKWDCKVCGKSGGYQMFLQQMVEHCRKNFTNKYANKLSMMRKIDVDTFKKFHIGYNPINESFIIPIWDENKKEIYNIRIYGNDKILRNCAGSKSALYGWWNVNKKHRTIWLCEGEWDSLVMMEVLSKMGDENSIVLGVPGANTFKAEWTGYFSGKAVHVLYDNDHDKTDKKGIFHPSAGKEGMWKVNENIKTIVKSIDFIHYPRIYPDGFDINDLYRKKKGNANRTLKQVEAMLKSDPPKINYPEGQEPERYKVNDKEEELTGDGLPPEEVYKGYRKWLYLPDVNCLDIAFGVVIANRLPGDPVWMFLIGPSGCGKSEIIMSLDDSPKIFALGRMTPHTLISGSTGSGGGDPSLIPKLDGKILAIKDFTNILGMNQQSRDDIFSQLRDAYDGKCGDAFGTGVIRMYESKFGILAGATEAIEMYLEGGTAMGERFLGYNFPRLVGYTQECNIMNKAIDNIYGEDKEKMRLELKEIAYKVLNYNFLKVPTISSEIKERTMALAYWTATMRGTIIRDRYSKEITHKAYREMPTRLVTQFIKLLLGIAQFRRKTEVSEEEYGIIKKIGIGTAPHHLELIVKNIWQEEKDAQYTNMDFSEILRLPSETCKRFAENLHQLGVLRSKKQQGSLISSWYLSDEFKKIISIAQIY